MSVESTIPITRGDAVAVILKYLPDANESELAAALFELIGRRRHRDFVVVQNYDETGWGKPYCDGELD